MLATIASLYLIRVGLSITDGKSRAKKEMTIFEDVSLLFQYVFGVLLSQSKLFATYILIQLPTNQSTFYLLRFSRCHGTQRSKSKSKACHSLLDWRLVCLLFRFGNRLFQRPHFFCDFAVLQASYRVSL